MTNRSEILERKIAAIVDSAPCGMGVSVALAGKGIIADVNSDRPFPLASVYKLPIMATLFHGVEEGEIDLGERLCFETRTKP